MCYCFRFQSRSCTCSWRWLHKAPMEKVQRLFDPEKRRLILIISLISCGTFLQTTIKWEPDHRQHELTKIFMFGFLTWVFLLYFAPLFLFPWWMELFHSQLCWWSFFFSLLLLVPSPALHISWGVTRWLQSKLELWILDFILLLVVGHERYFADLCSLGPHVQVEEFVVKFCTELKLH